MSYPKSSGRKSKGSSAKRETGVTTSKSDASTWNVSVGEALESMRGLTKSTPPKRRQTDFAAWLREPIPDGQSSSSTSTIS